MIKRLRAMAKEYDMPWKYRVVLAWCVAKLFREMGAASQNTLDF